jgi:hypothetical protein
MGLIFKPALNNLQVHDEHRTSRSVNNNDDSISGGFHSQITPLLLP